MKDKKFLKNAFIISLGGMISKAIGIIYRVPLAAILGCRGIGLYQMVYPFYCLLLTFCACGVPSALAKMVADSRYLGGKGIFRSAIRLFLSLGFLCSFLMIFLAPALSRAQGQPLTATYFSLAPALFFVSGVSSLRGWFQGKNDMFPTAFSEVVEQVVKVVSGLTAAYFFRDDLVAAVSASLFGVTVGEAVAFLYLLITYRKRKFILPLYTKNTSKREILKTYIPVTLSSAVLPLSQFVDSFLIVKLLNRFSFDGVALYGVFSGGALTLINLPASVCYGVAAAVIPKLSSLQGEKDQKNGVWYSLTVTLILGAVCAVGLYLFSGLAVKILFSGFSAEERAILAGLVRRMAIASVSLACVQTLSSCLVAKGKAGFSALVMLFAVLLKSLLFFLLINKKTGIYGAADAVNICYFFAFVLNFMLNFIKGGCKHDYSCGTRGREGRSYEKGRTGDFVGRKGRFKDCSCKIR